MTTNSYGSTGGGSVFDNPYYWQFISDLYDKSRDPDGIKMMQTKGEKELEQMRLRNLNYDPYQHFQGQLAVNMMQGISDGAPHAPKGVSGVFGDLGMGASAAKFNGNNLPAFWLPRDGSAIPKQYQTNVNGGSLASGSGTPGTGAHQPLAYGAGNKPIENPYTAGAQRSGGGGGKMARNQDGGGTLSEWENLGGRPDWGYQNAASNGGAWGAYDERGGRTPAQTAMEALRLMGLAGPNAVIGEQEIAGAPPEAQGYFSRAVQGLANMDPAKREQLLRGGTATVLSFFGIPPQIGSFIGGLLDRVGDHLLRGRGIPPAAPAPSGSNLGNTQFGGFGTQYGGKP